MSYPVATCDAYPPQLMELMSAACDAAGGRLLGEPSQAYQLQLTIRIMAAAKAGERDLERMAGRCPCEDEAVAPPAAAEPSTAA